MLVCPICKKPLYSKDNRFVCESNHSFDIAKEGYVNLLLSNKKNSLNPGDNQEMVNARECFLSKDYYAPLRYKICEYLNASLNSNSTMLDAGCGTGYYSSYIFKNCGYVTTLFGVDISKFAVQKAAKKAKNATFFVGSIFDLPISDKSIDVILNIFSPKAMDEYKRVIKHEGILIQVMPGKEHLIELKRAIYKDKTYENEVEYSYGGLNLLDKMHVRYNIDVDKDDMMHLFTMTPYLYKTPIDMIKELDKIDALNITIDFEIAIWQNA